MPWPKGVKRGPRKPVDPLRAPVVDAPIAAKGGEGLGLLDAILPWAVIIIFLMLGLQAAMSSSAQGASLAINFAKKSGAKIGGFTASQTLGRALATKQGAKTMEALEKTKLGMPETLKDWRRASWGKRIVSGPLALVAYPTRWGLRAGAKQGLIYGAKQPGAIEREKKLLEQQFGTGKEGAEKARAVAQKTLKEVKEKMGLSGE